MGSPSELEREAQGKHYVPQTEFGRKLLKLREEAIAKGMKLLTEDEILAEIRSRRGEDECHCGAVECQCHRIGLADMSKDLTCSENVSRKDDKTNTSALAEQVGGDHYKNLAIQPVEYIHKNKIPFIEGSVVKYVTRWREKGGVADLEKARHFLDMLIEMETTK